MLSVAKQHQAVVMTTNMEPKAVLQDVDEEDQMQAWNVDETAASMTKVDRQFGNNNNEYIANAAANIMGRRRVSSTFHSDGNVTTRQRSHQNKPAASDSNDSPINHGEKNSLVPLHNNKCQFV